MRKRLLALLLVTVLVCAVFAGCEKKPKRLEAIEKTTYGIDVARYQGTINYEWVKNSHLADFVMVRVGYRSMEEGIITEDPNARYNLQEAQRHDIQLGAYFFSTAITEEEAVEEANWIADILDGYRITYPVAYDCEGYNTPDSRQNGLSVEERTTIALAFLKAIEERGYEGMFYGARNDLEGDVQWQVSRIAPEYKIWVAQYPAQPYPVTPASEYTGEHHMWQYSQSGNVNGVLQPVDMNVAYFGYEGTNEPIGEAAPMNAKADPEALMDFMEVQETVTAKMEVNLRDIPSQGLEARVLRTLKNGEIAARTARSETGWSRLEIDGEVYYAVSSYLTTDLDYDPGMDMEIEPTEGEDDGLLTSFVHVNDKVTAKDAVNLRTLPSTEHPDCVIVTKLLHGQIITRTGIDKQWGWARVEWQGQTLYCINSYLEEVE